MKDCTHGHKVWPAGFAVMFGGLSAAAHAQTFRWLDSQPNALNCNVRAMSRDGRVVVGQADSAAGRLAFRWTESEGLVVIGTLPESFQSEGSGASSDGSVVVGSSSGGSYRPFRWTPLGGLLDLGLPPGESIGAATGVSSNGSVVAGAGVSRGLVWSIDGLGHASVRELDTLPLATQSAALAVSADGNVAVGFSGGQFAGRAVRWSVLSGDIQELAGMSGAQAAQAQSVNRDGSVIVGAAYGSSLARAFRWTSSTGMADLGNFPSGSYIQVHGTNDAGTVVVGTGSDFVTRGFVWRSGRGMVEINQYFAELQIDQTGWQIVAPVGIDANGRTIAGSAWNPTTNSYRGWIATIPPGCIADFDASSSVTIQDLFGYFAAWFASAASADVAEPMGVTQADLIEYIRAWFAGC